MNDKVFLNKQRGVKHIYNAVVADEDDKEVTFNIANNGQSSSILEMKTHLIEHPSVFYTKQEKMRTITLDTFLETGK